MEHITDRKVEKVEHVHDFYCDECNEYLGTAVEEDDGFVQPPDNLCPMILEIHMDDGWHRLEMHLCKSCYFKKNKRIKNILKKEGFKND